MSQLLRRPFTKNIGLARACCSLGLWAAGVLTVLLLGVSASAADVPKVDLTLGAKNRFEYSGVSWTDGPVLSEGAAVSYAGFSAAAGMFHVLSTQDGDVFEPLELDLMLAYAATWESGDIRITLSPYAMYSFFFGPFSEDFEDALILGGSVEAAYGGFSLEAANAVNVVGFERAYATSFSGSYTQTLLEEMVTLTVGPAMYWTTSRYNRLNNLVDTAGLNVQIQASVGYTPWSGTTFGLHGSASPYLNPTLRSGVSEELFYFGFEINQSWGGT
ncbi:MAG: hypothetical protein AAF550_02330 [Myxococcota bacterium]